jgi:hypothetical protein
VHTADEILGDFGLIGQDNMVSVSQKAVLLSH